MIIILQYSIKHITIKIKIKLLFINYIIRKIDGNIFYFRFQIHFFYRLYTIFTVSNLLL
jgi:hypothetical protein